MISSGCNNTPKFVVEDSKFAGNCACGLSRTQGYKTRIKIETTRSHKLESYLKYFLLVVRTHVLSSFFMCVILCTYLTTCGYVTVCFPLFVSYTSILRIERNERNITN